MTLTEGLVALLARPISGADRARAALHVADWIGCAAAGAASATGARFLEHEADLSRGLARVVLGGALAARDAALLNGAFGNVLEMDDVHREAVLHPGPVIIPAALALAAERDASGAALLDAVIRGYEAEIRLGRALGGGHYRHFHPTASCGAFGAAAACASLLGLDGEGVVDALGNAASVAGGLWRCRHEAVATKQWHTAHAAACGLDAARLAARGVTGPRAILEGEQGFFAGLAPMADPTRVLADPDTPWLIHETSFKPWPACRHAHAAIDAALLLRAQGVVAPRAIVVRTYADAIAFCDRPTPNSEVQAKFSLQHAVAVTLLDGPPPLSAFATEALARADVAALRACVRIEEDPALTAAYPRHFGAEVVADGGACRVADALGDPENPLAPSAVLEKARSLLRHAGATDGCLAAALALAEGGSARALNACLP